MTRLALASAGAFFCVLTIGGAVLAQAQQRSIDNHGTWDYNFKSQKQTQPGKDADRPRRTRSARNKAPDQEKADTLVRFADTEGRRYNPSSKVWFDGKSACWSGKAAFTFKRGTWYYGETIWTQSASTWSAAEGAQPELVSCESDPAFAAQAKEHAAAATTSSTVGAATVTATPRSNTEPPRAGIKAGCKKYFPSIGQMLTVPCGD